MCRWLVLNYTSTPEDLVFNKVARVALTISGVLVFVIAAYADAKDGINVRMLTTWSSEILRSQHISFSLPMRVAGVLLFLMSFLF